MESEQLEWVAVGTDNYGAGPGKILWSNDGKTWTQSDLIGVSFDEGKGVAYGTSDGTNPLWVVVGNNYGDDKNILRSGNGKHWYESTDSSFKDAGFGVAEKHLLYGMDKSYYH